MPADAAAAVLNVTVVSPAADAFATVFPCGHPVPTASNLNYRAGDRHRQRRHREAGRHAARPASTPSPPPTCSPTSTATSPSAPRIGTLDPARLLDTRGPNSTVDGAGAGSGAAPAGRSPRSKSPDAPACRLDAAAAVLNVTVVGPAADAFATVFPCGQPVPTASNVNYRTGDRHRQRRHRQTRCQRQGMHLHLRLNPPSHRRQRLHSQRSQPRHADPGTSVGHPQRELDRRRGRRRDRPSSRPARSPRCKSPDAAMCHPVRWQR